jgi:hypothetical protein
LLKENGMKAKRHKSVVVGEGRIPERGNSGDVILISS